jgi:ketosteroid isomerase-like protein
MNMSLLRTVTLVLLLVLPLWLAGCGTSSASAPASCSAPEFHQFDFWIGDWNAFDSKTGEKAAHVRVEPILDGCVLQESYDGTDSRRGRSFTMYDATRRVWHQTWVTNQGQLLTIEGKSQNNGMSLAGSRHTNTGMGQLVRGTWKPTQDGVREIAVVSDDAGTSWTWFDLSFKRATDDDDAKVVSALDTQYQAAVKVNDVSTMDRILADDFVLVTGSGKVYNKTDLLNDARGNPTYEHNEELEQKVRVYGNTAIVTAKLWEKGVDHGKAFDHILWFSDTYVRTSSGWRYVFGQSSLSLPKTP